MKEIIERAKKQAQDSAFPFVSAEVFSTGLTLRDYFAAKAMQGMINIHYDMFLDRTYECWVDEGLPGLSEQAYLLADAMLKARNK